MQIVKRKRAQATPHLYIDFIPFTTGSKRGLETRVSLKKALEALGFPLIHAIRGYHRRQAYSHSSAPARRRLLFRLPGGWQVGSDRPFCRSLGNGQTTTVLQSSFLLKACCYRDKISVYYCCAMSAPFQRLFKSFWAILGIAKQDARKSLRAVMYDKWATAALPKNGSRPRVVRRTI